ncbi:hypothetical protein [Microcoleus phage My-WqHQDG]|nr:hypothetical protein [Microcoleus phage My-WqHQDG]
MTLNRTLDNLLASLDVDGHLPRAVIRIYSTGGPEHGTLLGDIQCTLPAFTNAVDAQSIMNPTTPCTSALASGKADLAIFMSRKAEVIFSLPIVSPPPPGQAYDEAVIILENTSIRKGDTISISYLSLNLKRHL